MSRPVSILLVEDNRMDVELTLDAFQQARFSNAIHVARNGQEALDHLFGHGDYSDRTRFPRPDLVLLDLKMPRISGHEVLRKIRTTEGLKRIPAAILASSRDEGDLAMSYDNGANSYLVKAVSFEGFLNVVHQIGGYWLTLNVGPPDTDSS